MQQINFADEIKKLVELQELDKDIYGINRELDHIPEHLRALDELIKDKESIFKGNEDALIKLQLKRKDKEMELGTKEQDILKNQNQLFQIKTNQEYSAMQREIESKKADKSVLEEDIINILDEIENAEKALADSKKVYQEEKSKIEAEKKEVEQKKGQIQEEQKKIQAARNELVKNIDKELLGKYEKILQGKDGLALVPVEGNACGGCNMNLPPQVVNEVCLRKTVVICGNCSRILYHGE